MRECVCVCVYICSYVYASFILNFLFNFIEVLIYFCMRYFIIHYSLCWTTLILVVDL